MKTFSTMNCLYRIPLTEMFVIGRKKASTQVAISLVRYLWLAVLVCWHVFGVAVILPVQAAQLERLRYDQIRKWINSNRHLSAHMVRAVDARTIKEVRKHISEKDMPVLLEMLGDKDYGVASAASSLLATQGKKAVPALLEAKQSRNWQIANQATDALRLIDDCYNPDLWDRMNPDLCPADRVKARQTDDPIQGK